MASEKIMVLGYKLNNRRFGDLALYSRKPNDYSAAACNQILPEIENVWCEMCGMSRRGEHPSPSSVYCSNLYFFLSERKRIIVHRTRGGRGSWRSGKFVFMCDGCFDQRIFRPLPLHSPSSAWTFSWVYFTRLVRADINSNYEDHHTLSKHAHKLLRIKNVQRTWMPMILSWAVFAVGRVRRIGSKVAIAKKSKLLKNRSVR